MLVIAQKLAEHLKTNKGALRANQVRAFRKLIAFVKAGKTQGLIKQPTGAGKTRLFGEILFAIKRNSLILVPRENLLSQTFDQLVGDPERDIDGVGFKRKEVLVQTDKNSRATDWMYSVVSKLKRNAFPRVVIMTYHSFISVTKRDKKVLDAFMAHIEVMVSDEAHRSLGGITQKAIKEYSDEEELELKEEAEIDALSANFKVLHLRFTATPVLMQNDVLTAYNIKKIDSLTINTLEKDGTLIAPTIIGGDIIGTATMNLKQGMTFSSLNDAYIEKMAGDKGFVMDDGTPVANVVAEKYVELKKKCGGYLPGVVFCVNIRQAEMFAQYLRTLRVRAVRCTSQNVDFDKGVSVKDLQRMFHNDEIDVVTTVSKISEGFDAPTLRCAMWLAPTMSHARFIQANGRVLRSLSPNSVHPKKTTKNTFIIYPDWCGRSHAGSKKIGIGRRKNPSHRGGQYTGENTVEQTMSLPNFYEIMVMAGEYTEAELHEKKINIRKEFRLLTTWMKNYIKLIQFRKKEKRIPKSTEPEGRWYAAQLCRMKKGLLSDDERDLLDKFIASLKREAQKKLAMPRVKKEPPKPFKFYEPIVQEKKPQKETVFLVKTVVAKQSLPMCAVCGQKSKLSLYCVVPDYYTQFSPKNYTAEKKGEDEVHLCKYHLSIAEETLSTLKPALDKRIKMPEAREPRLYEQLIKDFVDSFKVNPISDEVLRLQERLIRLHGSPLTIKAIQETYEAMQEQKEISRIMLIHAKREVISKHFVYIRYICRKYFLEKMKPVLMVKQWKYTRTLRDK